MDIFETQQKIMNDGDFVLQEIKKLRFLFGLKKEMRFDQKRDFTDGADTVADHVYGMHVLFDYFWPLENPEGSWNQIRMRQMINFHDLEEVVTGDIIGYLKTDEHRKAEEKARLEVFKSIPESMVEKVSDLIQEYEARETIESKFVKAIDKIEPVIQLFNDEGRSLLHRMGTTRQLHDSIKLPYFKPFPVITSFYDFSIEEMDSKGFFVDPT